MSILAIKSQLWLAFVAQQSSLQTCTDVYTWGNTDVNWQLFCDSLATGRPYFVQFLAFQTMCSSWPYSWLVVAAAAAAANACAAFGVAAATISHETVLAA